MAVKIIIPASFRKLIKNKSNIKCEPGKLFEILRYIKKKYPELSKRILNDDGDLKGYVQIFINKKIQNHINRDMAIKDGTIIRMIVVVGGG